MQQYKVVLLLIISLCFGKSGYAQAYNFNYLSIKDGLPQSQAFCITFDKRECAWIGTQGGGLCRFDGELFQYFTKADSLISNRVYSTKAFDKQIWIGQKGGVSVFNLEGQFLRNYRATETGLVINDILQHENRVLLATNLGLYEIIKEVLIKVEASPLINQADIQQFYLTPLGELWLCSNQGLLNMKDYTKRYFKGKYLSSSLVECAAYFKESHIVGCYEGGISVIGEFDLAKAAPLKQLQDKTILSLYVSGDNELWIGTMNNGLYLYNSETNELRNFKTTNGLSSNHVKIIKADYWGNIWIGTSGGGISIFQNSPFIAYNNASGLNNDYVYSVRNDKKNNLWIGTDGMGVMRINDTSKVLFDEEFGFQSEKVKSIFEDKQGDIWFGTEGKGLGLYTERDNKDTIYSYYNSNGLKGNWIRSFAQTNNKDRVYIGTADAGIFYLDKSNNSPSALRFKKIQTTSGVAPKRITCLFGADSKLWFSQEGGFGFYENKQVVNFKEAGKTFRNVVVKGNVVWLGSTDDGILRLEMNGDSIVNKQWITAAQSSGLSSNVIFQMVYTNNELWIGTERGLDRLKLDSLQMIISSEHYGYEEGFEGVETNINAGNVDNAGNLWFGTVEGLYVYKDRGTNPTQRKAPVLRLTDFQIVFKSINDTEYANAYNDGEMIEDLMLPYNQNHISFQFKAIHYSYSKNIRYRWILEGIDPDWSPSTKVNIATYPNLPAGNYTFKVQTAIDEKWNQDPINISFSIDKPYWDKFWFKFAYYCLIGLIILLVVFIFLRRQKRKSKALNEKLTLEKNLIELEQKALRLQMNPHFIFNVLNSIHNLIILQDSDKARYALSKFSKLMRQVLENSREKFISIDDEIETLQNYVQLERLTSNAKISLNFEFDSDLDTTELVLPPLMIQPFVENAIVHGLMGAKKEGEIIVSFKWLNDQLLECSISDNGVGRKKADEIKAQKEAYHKSTALQVTQERLANLNKEVSFIPFEIIDLKDNAGNPAGTKVIVRILV